MKQAIEIFLHYDPTAYPEPRFMPFSCDLSGPSNQYLFIRKQVVELEIPDDFNPIAAQVDALKSQREIVAREFGSRLMAIDESIGKLLSLTNEVAA